MSTLGNWIDSLRAKLSHLAPEIDPVLTFLEVALAAIGGTSAAAAVQVIKTALDSLAAQAGGTLTHDELVQKLADLKAEAVAQITAIEGAQDAALEARFPEPPASEPAP